MALNLKHIAYFCSMLCVLTFAGFSNAQEKKTPTTLDEANKIVEANPTDAMALYNRGVIRLNLGGDELDGAIKDLRTAATRLANAETGPNQKKLLTVRTELENAYRKSIEYFNKPTDTAKVASLRGDLCNVLMELQKYSDVIIEADLILSDPALAEVSWWAYNARGAAYAHTSGRKNAAIENFKQAIKIAMGTNDDNITAVMTSVTNHLHISYGREVIEYAVEVGGEQHPMLRLYIVYDYFYRQDYKMAQEEIDKLEKDVDKLSNTDKKAYYAFAGSINMHNRAFDKAQIAYEKQLQVPKGKNELQDTAALNNLAMLHGELLEQKDLPKALAYSTKAIEAMEHLGIIDPNINDTHGWMLVLNNKSDEGIDFLNEALKARPDFYESHYHLGIAYLNRKMGPQAREEFEKAQAVAEEQKNKRLPIEESFEKKLADAVEKAKELQ